MKKLEAYQAFSYVAWTVVVAFSLFTYNLVLDLQKSLEQLETITSERVSLASEGEQ